VSRRLVARARSSEVLTGSAWILIGLSVQSGLGFAFWLLGSRVATSSELGRASALYTAIQFVNYASGLGLTVALARHASDRSNESDRLFGWGVVATVLSSIVGGLLFLALSTVRATEVVTGSPLGWALFCAYTAGISVSLLVDVRLMAARRWGWLVGRLAVAGLVRLPLVLVGVGMRPDAWLYHLMLAPLAIVGVASVPFLGRMGAGSASLRRPRTLGAVARYSGVNWLATLASQAPQFVLPLVVAQSVVPSVNASFFLAWTITGMIFLLPGAIAQVLLVEGSKDELAREARAGDGLVGDGAAPDGPASGGPANGGDAPDREAGRVHEPDQGRAREALAFSVGLAAVAWAGSLAAGPIVRVVFGDSYRALARLLSSLLAAGVPWAITSVRLSEARIRRDQLATVLITATLGLGILVPVVVFVPGSGTLAATRSWLFGNVAAAVVAVAVHQRARHVPRLGAASG
jgi:O-antigen/teichoic acid export membrane protein